MKDAYFGHDRIEKKDTSYTFQPMNLEIRELLKSYWWNFRKV